MLLNLLICVIDIGRLVYNDNSTFLKEIFYIIVVVYFGPSQMSHCAIKCTPIAYMNVSVHLHLHIQISSLANVSAYSHPGNEASLLNFPIITSTSR